MLNANESRVGPAAAIENIEKQMEAFFAAQQSEVEKGLLEKINREKEEAQKKIDTVRREFEKVRGILEEHRAVMTELELARESLRTRIQEHFVRAMDHHKLMEQAATLSIDELQRIDDLSRQLAEIRQRAVEETSTLRELLKGHAGIASELPAFSESSEPPVDWSKELSKMKKVQALLTSSNGSEAHDAAPFESAEPAAASAPSPEPSPASATEPAEPAAEPVETAPPASYAEPAAEGPPDGAEFAESDPGWDDIPAAASHAAPHTAAPAAPETIEDVVPEQARTSDSLSKVLADYRKSEPINNGIELGFFEVGTTAMLDGESFVTAIGKICAGARDLHDQLTRTESVKDLFLLKQEILNQQEVLRKVYFRVVRFCDKESGVLPAYLDEILNVPAMKDSLERLTMANWSDPSDFAPFVREIAALRAAFAAKTDPPGDYIQSVLEQIGLN
ncbi:MAG: hypothetical protein FJY79_05140 [Candidatus Aminicenantes bacterium]|nr:hypothetical protein [Candidatus Aminicenantes bacterium]